MEEYNEESTAQFVAAGFQSYVEPGAGEPARTPLENSKPMVEFALRPQLWVTGFLSVHATGIFMLSTKRTVS